MKESFYDVEVVEHNIMTGQVKVHYRGYNHTVTMNGGSYPEDLDIQVIERFEDKGLYQQKNEVGMIQPGYIYIYIGGVMGNDS